MPELKLDEPNTLKLMEDIEGNSNILELIITDLLKGRKVEKNKIMCDGRIKA